MKNAGILWGGITAIVILLASCGTTAHIEKDENVNFNQFRTFAWVDKDNGERQSLTEQRVRSAVNAELQKTAGWREVRNKPDVYLSYDVLVEKSLKQENNPVYSHPTTRVFYNPRTNRYVTVYYPSRFIGYDRDMRETREGTVTISMIDAHTDKTIWQGWTTDEVQSRNLTSKEIQQSVRSIFRKFDIAKN